MVKVRETRVFLMSCVRDNLQPIDQNGKVRTMPGEWDGALTKGSSVGVEASITLGPLKPGETQRLRWFRALDHVTGVRDVLAGAKQLR